MLRSIPADEARDLLLSLPVQLRTEEVPLSAALGRVLAGTVYTTVPLPPFDRSPFDGYALRWEDAASATRQAPVRLRVLEEIPAGRAPEKTVVPGTAAKILTGGPIPQGANAVIKFEETERQGENVCLFAPLKPCQNVIRRGEETAEGEKLLSDGVRLGPAELALLAAQGRAAVTVYRRPRVAVLTTGSELTAPGEPLEPGMIYDSNLTMMAALLERTGMEVLPLGRVPDCREKIAEQLRLGLDRADIVLTTGGASVGDYDFAVRAAELVGAEPLFWKVQMKPGGCILAARKDEKLILSLSGNPGAAAVGLLRVLMPCLRRWCGRADALPEEVELPLRYPVKKKSPVDRLLRGRLEIAEGKAWFTENDHQGNGMISSLRSFELLGLIPAGSPTLDAGTVIRAWRYTD